MNPVFSRLSHHSAWAQSQTKLPETVKQKSNAEKCLILVLWPFNRVHSLTDVLKGTAYNSAFFFDVIVPNLVADIQS
jgi:hypothetical protein